MAAIVRRPLGMPKLYFHLIEDALPAGLVHTVWYFEKSVQVRVNQ